MQGMGISMQVLEKIQALAEKHHIKKVILFGSRARGDYKRTSDIDLAIEGGNYSGFVLDVEEFVPTLLMFDIVNLDGSVQDELRCSIKEEGVLLYEEA